MALWWLSAAGGGAVEGGDYSERGWDQRAQKGWFWTLGTFLGEALKVSETWGGFCGFCGTAGGGWDRLG